MAAPAPNRLTVEKQPITEGPFRLKGDVRRPSDADCGFEVLDSFERFNQCNDIYSRAQWDERVRTKKAIDDEPTGKLKDALEAFGKKFTA